MLADEDMVGNPLERFEQIGEKEVRRCGACRRRFKFANGLVSVRV
jgi:hypothetical protein